VAEQMPKTMTPSKDLKPVMDEIDRILASPTPPKNVPPMDAPMDAPPMDKPPMDAPADAPKADAAPKELTEDGRMLADALNVSPERGQMMFDCAQEMPQLMGMDAAAIADAVTNDMDLRMQLEARVAAKYDSPKGPEGTMGDKGSFYGEGG
tara:strand:- start:7943 stop:8395 length:453 start_codon:yes stop_codon:yes gene_type:complete